MEKDKIDDIATNVSSELVVSFTSILDEWSGQLRALVNGEIPNSAIGGMMFENFYFSIYYLAQKWKNNFTDDESRQFLKAFEEKTIFYLATLYFHSNTRDKNEEDHLKSISKIFYDFYSSRLAKYVESSATPQLFREYVQVVINNSPSKLKFVELNMGNRFKLGLAKTLGALGGSNSEFNVKHGDERILDMKVLDAYINAVVKVVESLNFDKIISDIN